MKRNDHPSNSPFKANRVDDDLEIDHFENDPELQALAAQIKERGPEGVMNQEFRESLRSTLLHEYKKYQMINS